MFKKLSNQEIRASIMPFEHLFMTAEQFEEFKKKSREHKTSEDYTITREPIPENKPNDKPLNELTEKISDLIV